jgi:hypothetical protein
MTDFKERRNYPRVTVEGAMVAFKKKTSMDFWRGFSSELPLRDLAKGGICFQSDALLDQGVTIEIKLFIPGERRLNIKGNIVWSDNITDNGRTFAGVRFLPFGKGKMYNSFECWDKLEQITSQNKNNQVN